MNSKIDLFILFLTTAFLFTFFNPFLLFLKTVPAGGDTPSHYMTCLYMKEYLLPNGKVMGWFMGNYAGFPILYHYFPLPFIFATILSFILPLEVSFKIVTVLGTFLLPFTVYLFFRLLRFERPVPIVGSISTLAFLFNEKNSMWGGNIPSTLAGEFSFSLSLSIFVLLLGTFFRGVEEKRHVILNSCLFALMALSHGYTTLTFCAISTFFLFRREFFQNLLYLLRFYFLSFCFISFWFIPFLFNLPYTTPSMFKWAFSSIFEVFPPILIPFFILSVPSFLLGFRDKRMQFLAFSILISLLLYFLAYPLRLGDIRFLSFTQFFLALSPATLFSLIRFQEKGFLPIIALFVTLFWVELSTTYTRDWIWWNFTGLEAKRDFSELMEIFDYLKRHNDGGRVAYEHSSSYDRFGTIRIFELMRMFAGRDTLEGLYMQSSISAPFVFYIQSEISDEVSAPFWQYPVTTLNLELASRHLPMFGVTHLLVRSERVKKEIRRFGRLYALEKRIGDVEIYRVKTTVDRLVTPARFEPVLFTKRTWKRDFYEWFKKPDTLHVPLVFEDEKASGFRLKTDDIKRIPVKPLSLPSNTYTIRVTQKPERIEFETPFVGHPHIIRISYHPFWKVQGAKKIYLCAPSFMLVIPERPYVSLVFSRSFLHYISETITALSIIFCLFVLIMGKRGLKEHVEPV